MRVVSNRSVHFENPKFSFSSICISHNMDYRQKMVVAPNKTHTKDDGEDDDDEDLEALRMAALQSLRPKDNPRMNIQSWQLQTRINTHQQIAQPRSNYKGQRPIKRPIHQARPIRQNGGLYFQNHLTNPNLITIVPVEEDIAPPQSEQPSEKLRDPESPRHDKAPDESKFCRYRDEASGSEDEDDADRKGDVSTKVETEVTADEKGCSETAETSDAENASIHNESPQRSEEEEKEEDDDDVLLMADLEEEDSLERLMDEMEKEMNVDKPANAAGKRHSRKENKSGRKEEINSRKQKDSRVKLEPRRTNRSSSPTIPSASLIGSLKNEPRPLSPYNSNRGGVHRRRSLSPKQRSRKKSPRKSPRRSPPPRQSTKSSQRGDGGREPLRFRSPRKSPPRFSPRPRSPRISPRRSPPLRLSPRSSPYLRSPGRLPRSRSPRISSPRPRSPRILRSRSPRSPRRSPLSRLSPRKLSPRLIRSPKLSPRRLSPRARSPRISPRRISPRGRSPRLSPRRLSPRGRSPRLTPPRRNSPRGRSPGISPHRSPWSSPRNSPRLSPRRRRSPKELSRKIRPRSITPCRHQSPISRRGSSPNLRGKSSLDESVKSKLKQKEETSYEKLATEDAGKGMDAVNNDPVLEARRRKFESTKPIDPVNANKKIKLSRKEIKNEKSGVLEEREINTTTTSLTRSEYKVVNEEEEDGKGGEDEGREEGEEEEVEEEIEYETIETDSYIGVDFEFGEDLEEPIEDSPTATIASAVNVCSEIEPAKLEREKPVKKKKKKDKELYQVHRSKGELPLSERIGKEKKCKKRKEVTTGDSSTEKTETIFEDLTVDEEEGDLRTELSRRRAERLNRSAPIHQQSVRLVQSAFKGVVSEVVKSNAKSIRKQLGKADDKQNRKEVRRVTVLHRPVSDLQESDEETIMDSKVPVRFRLGVNKSSQQETRESKISRKNSKRQSRKE